MTQYIKAKPNQKQANKTVKITTAKTTQTTTMITETTTKRQGKYSEPRPPDGHSMVEMSQVSVDRRHHKPPHPLHGEILLGDEVNSQKRLWYG